MTVCSFFFFLNDPAPTEIYTLPLHAALPIWIRRQPGRLSRTAGSSSAARHRSRRPRRPRRNGRQPPPRSRRRSEEHTSELQSRQYLVCRLLLEKKKQIRPYPELEAHNCTLTP